MNPNKLNGKKVVGSEGYIIGEVDGIDVDTDKWQATALYVSLTDDTTVELGFKKPFMSRIVVCLPTKTVKAIGEVITLKESLKTLKDVVEQVQG
jgi:sporulation protein YlmC with PRC-barrel domain